MMCGQFRLSFPPIAQWVPAPPVKLAVSSHLLLLKNETAMSRFQTHLFAKEEQ